MAWPGEARQGLARNKGKGKEGLMKKVKVIGKVVRKARDGSWYDIDFGFKVIRVPADKVKKRIF